MFIQLLSKVKHFRAEATLSYPVVQVYVLNNVGFKKFNESNVITERSFNRLEFISAASRSNSFTGIDHMISMSANISSKQVVLKDKMVPVFRPFGANNHKIDRLFGRKPKCRQDSLQVEYSSKAARRLFQLTYR